MDLLSLACCSLIVLGAIVMLMGLLGSREFHKALPYVPERQRAQIRLYLAIHRALMVFFLGGYLVVLVALICRWAFISNIFVSVIFFFGAVFVFIGMTIQARLLAEVQKTLHGILPICCKCKKIRQAGTDPKDPTVWKRPEDYLSQATAVDFSHGYCPDCLAEELKVVHQMAKQA